MFGLQKLSSVLTKTLRYTPTTTCRAFLSTSQSFLSDKRIVKFRTSSGDIAGEGKIGDSLLDVVVNNDLPLDGFGACEGTLACCTCHVILRPEVSNHVILRLEHFERVDLVNPTSEEELDLLDLAPDLTDFSRLGCQVKIEKKDPDIIEVTVPDVKRDARTLE